MRLLATVALMTCALASSAHAQAPPVGPLVLRLPATPRTAALGNAWVAGRDYEVVFYNPAQLIGARSEFNLSMTRLGPESTMGTLGSVYAAGKWSLTLGWGVQVVDFKGPPTVEGVGVQGSPTIKNGFSALVTVGGAVVYKGLRMGAAGKYASDHVTTAPGSPSTVSVNQSAMLADVGVAKNMFGGVAALSVQNLGRDSLDGVSPHTIPRQVLLGWSAARNAGPLDLVLVSQVTVRNGWTSPGAGLEVGYSWIEGYVAALRVGVRRPETRAEYPLTIGAAFTADRLTIEYAAQFFDGGRSANGVTIRWR